MAARNDAGLHADRREIAAIFIGGAIGAAARAELALVLPVRAGSWPWPTFIVNVTGALMLAGVATVLQERRPMAAYHHPLLATGFCGTLTTFATMQVELVAMLTGGHVVLAVGYLGATLACGLLGVAVTTGLVRRRSVTS